MKIFAHRGFSGRYPQNTMLAFQKALESGCDGIELDVQLTKDGVPVIIHDEYLDDLTDFKGFVRDYTYEQLKKCNAAGKYNETYGFCPIPTFQEYCEWVKQTELVTNVEIKSSVYYYEDIEEKVMALIERYGLADRIILSSFNHLSAVICKELHPGLCTGALTENGGIEMDSLPETAEPLANVKFQVTKMEQDQAGKWNETTITRTVVTNESGEAVLEDLPL